MAAVAEELGVSAGLLGRWVKAERERTGEGADYLGEISANERQEPIRLRKENAELKLDNELL
ncbi:transposase [Corynebacterium glutamicum]|uniref:transposase n=1 Tax=Corynebacterium glutamicum TaxID=1718 RepID=UPI000942A1B2|nr:transposase [Corynebacterium glutamicum]